MTPLVESLGRLKRDRGAMAALRKALIREHSQRCFKYLPRIGCKFENEQDTLRFCIVAHYWGHHPKHTDGLNFGKSLSGITNYSDKHSFNRRFERLIASDSLEELSEQLRPVVSLLSKKGIGVDFNMFLDHLFLFTTTPDRVKAAWCGGFYVREADLQ